MKRPLPSGKEQVMTFEELFFSRTDSRGVIQFGNEVFLRMAQYPREIMIGAPHSLIRHPDMPRSVFKIFWEFLKAGRPIGAYVNNLAADGSNYWVFAAAFPIEGGYLSIRLKPSSEIHDLVKNLYAKILKEEERGGMEDGEKALLESLAAAGFPTYESFMSKALGTELGLRDRELLQERDSGKREAETSGDPLLRGLRQVNDQAAGVFREIFAVVSDFIEAQDVFTKQTLELLTRFKTVRFLSINMTASAEKFGESATSLAVISQEFQKMASQIEAQLRAFVGLAEELNLDMQASSFNISSLKLQMDMVDTFVRESLDRSVSGALDDRTFSDLRDNRAGFEELAQRSIRDVLGNLSRLRGKIAHFQSSLEEIETFASGLELIRQMGSMESARKSELQAAFANQISELKDFTGFLRSSSKRLEDSTRTLVDSVQVIDKRIPVGGSLMKEIFRRALSRPGAAVKAA